MNTSDDSFDRLVRAARAHQVNEPVPPLSPWLEQRVIMALREKTSAAWLDGGLLLHFLVGGAVLAVFSMVLPFTFKGNPYIETLNWTSPITYLEKVP